MKKLFAGLLLCLAALPALATDYNIGQCYVETTCYFGSAPSAATSFSDTTTFVLGDWSNPTGIYKYESSSNVEVYGGRYCVSGSGRDPRPTCVVVVIDSATLDGVPMTPPVSGYTWVTPISLTPGSHTVVVTGHSGGYPGRWVGRIDGLAYSFVPAPPPPPCTSNCGDD